MAALSPADGEPPVTWERNHECGTPKRVGLILGEDAWLD
jgi:hypothetical protein